MRTQVHWDCARPDSGCGRWVHHLGPACATGTQGIKHRPSSWTQERARGCQTLRSQDHVSWTSYMQRVRKHLENLTWSCILQTIPTCPLCGETKSVTCVEYDGANVLVVNFCCSIYSTVVIDVRTLPPQTTWRSRWYRSSFLLPLLRHCSSHSFSVNNLHTHDGVKPYVRSKGRKFEKARGRRRSNGFKVRWIFF